jgi:hypothetical protein
MSDEATVSEHFVHAAQQQMDRCYALRVEGHSSLGEDYDQLLRKTLKEAGVTAESPMEERDAIQNKLRKAWCEKRPLFLSAFPMFVPSLSG